MPHLNRSPGVPHQTEDGDDDLYVAYVQFLQDAQAEIRRSIPPGATRQRCLAEARIETRAAFQARLVDIRQDPEFFAAWVALLRTGYRPL